VVLLVGGVGPAGGWAGPAEGVGWSGRGGGLGYA
jgi:hypothetical protein